MGPQLRSCGNICDDRSTHRGPWWLQWGRSFAAAEMSRCSNTRCPSGVASMGPQLRSCGNQADRRAPLHRAGAASMGPQLRSCGNQGRAEHLSRMSLASMGPQLRSCGNMLPAVMPLVMPGWLQWGRSFAAAEMPPRWARSWAGQRLQWGRSFAAAEMHRSGSKASP